MQDEEADYSGMTLHIHPDLLRSYSLNSGIRQYGFFSYSAAEALYLSEKEKITILSIYRFIQDELSERIDKFSQDVIISQIEVLLNYANRFYDRQFLTRKAVNHDLIASLDELLNNYFINNSGLRTGLPSVQFISQSLQLSPRYLSDMLRSITGQTTQQYIQQAIIEKAKEKLSATRLSVSEIAYQLGFEHPQSFSKLFKAKTNVSPLVFRQSFD